MKKNTNNNVDINKGTSYRRKQEEMERSNKTKKRSKRLAAYGDNARAKSSEILYQYMNGTYTDEF